MTRADDAHMTKSHVGDEDAREKEREMKRWERYGLKKAVAHVRAIADDAHE